MTTPLTFSEEQILLRNVEEETILRAGKRLPPDRIPYFRMGLQAGIYVILVQLSAKGKIDRRTT